MRSEKEGFQTTQRPPQEVSRRPRTLQGLEVGPKIDPKSIKIRACEPPRPKTPQDPPQDVQQGFPRTSPKVSPRFRQDVLRISPESLRIHPGCPQDFLKICMGFYLGSPLDFSQGSHRIVPGFPPEANVRLFVGSWWRRPRVPEAFHSHGAASPWHDG